METINYYDQKEGEIVRDNSQEVWDDVEQLKASHSICDLMVWLEVSLFYECEYSEEVRQKYYLYREIRPYTEAEKDFDAFVINELGFKWLCIFDDPPPIDYSVKKIFSREEAEEIKKKLILKSKELGVEASAWEYEFNQICPWCGRISGMQVRFHKSKCDHCGLRLPDKYPWTMNETITFHEPSFSFYKKVKYWIICLMSNRNAEYSNPHFYYRILWIKYHLKHLLFARQ